MRVPITIVLGGLLALPFPDAHAATLAVEVEIPSLMVAEYHRPYVAIFLEGADQKVAANLAVWSMSNDTAEGHGAKWLPDLRQWWRKSGRTLALPVDGVSGPTRPAGRHALRFDNRHPALRRLAAGRYTLVVEAAREVGGRELLKIPFDWPGGSPGTTQAGRAQGSSELGTVSLAVTP